MKRRWLAMLIVVITISGLFAVTLLDSRRQHNYTITTAFEFPVIPEGEHPKYRTAEAAAKFYWVSDEVIAQMTTEALLETYLTCPATFRIFLRDSKIGGFSQLVNAYHYGVAKLLLREDLPEVLLDRYLQTEVFDYAAKEGEYEFFERESQDVWQLRYMEVMAACLDLDLHDKTEGRIIRAIERNYQLYGGGHKGFYQGMSIYFFSVWQNQHWPFQGETYKTKNV